MNTKLLAIFILAVTPTILYAASDILATKIKLQTWLGYREFQDLCEQASIPCGSELSQSELGLGEYATFPEMSLQALLDQLTASTFKGYKWSLNAGVLQMRPAGPWASPLETRLAEVKIEDKDVWFAAQDIWEQTGLIKCSLSSNNGKMQKFGMVSIHLKDVTVREALNSLVKKEGQSMWIFDDSRADCDPIFIRSYRKWGPGEFESVFDRLKNGRQR